MALSAVRTLPPTGLARRPVPGARAGPAQAPVVRDPAALAPGSPDPFAESVAGAGRDLLADRLRLGGAGGFSIQGRSKQRPGPGAFAGTAGTGGAPGRSWRSDRAEADRRIATPRADSAGNAAVTHLTRVAALAAAMCSADARHAGHDEGGWARLIAAYVQGIDTLFDASSPLPPARAGEESAVSLLRLMDARIFEMKMLVEGSGELRPGKRDLALRRSAGRVAHEATSLAHRIASRVDPPDSPGRFVVNGTALSVGGIRRDRPGYLDPMHRPGRAAPLEVDRRDHPVPRRPERAAIDPRGAPDGEGGRPDHRLARPADVSNRIASAFVERSRVVDGSAFAVARASTGYLETARADLGGRKETAMTRRIRHESAVRLLQPVDHVLLSHADRAVASLRAWRRTGA